MLATALLLATAFGTTPAAAPAAQYDLHEVERNLVHYTNLQRQRHGLPALTVDPRLMSSARRHCSWMARSGSLQHTTATVAENIAMGQDNSSHAVQSWMTSPGHRANMLGNYSRMGAAAYTGSNGRVFWCVQFLR